MKDAIHHVVIHPSKGSSATDAIAVEEPLEIRLTWGPIAHRRRQVLSVTMRTPGHDQELAAGYLATEGILTSPEEILETATDEPNAIRMILLPDVTFDDQRHARTGYTSSSCGVCGKQSIESILRAIEPIPVMGRKVPADFISSLPEQIREQQSLFKITGGIHAAAIINPNGMILTVREDVGRHNAADKVLGLQFLKNAWPLVDHLLFVSGRASFELVQKAAMAGVSIMAAVGAPSSLAVELAQEVGMTLCGFVREGRFNIYSHPSRIDV